MDKYIYLVSSGEFSSYSVDALAVSDHIISKELLEEWSKEYSGGQTPDLNKFLTAKGLKIIYATGEFWETG